MSEGIPASRFYMWRAVVAMAHADGIVTAHEINFLQEQMKAISLSAGQLQILGWDLSKPQDIQTMFRQINVPQDRHDFFKFARVLSWSDGDYAAQERHILDYLEQDMTDDETRHLLKESRNSVREIVLNSDQWDKQVKEKGFLGLLNRLVA